MTRRARRTARKVHIQMYEVIVIVFFTEETLTGAVYEECEYVLRTEEVEFVEDVFEKDVFEEVVFEHSSWKHELDERAYSGAIYSQLIKHSSSRIHVTKVVKQMESVYLRGPLCLGEKNTW